MEVVEKGEVVTDVQPMAKTVLGRGLGSLMGDKSREETNGAHNGGTSSNGATPGFKTLLAASNRSSALEVGKEVRSARLSLGRVPLWYFLALDLLLLVMAAAVVLSGEPSTNQVVLAGMAVFLGCAVVVLGINLGRGDVSLRGGEMRTPWLYVRQPDNGGLERWLMVRSEGGSFACELTRAANGRISATPVEVHGNGKIAPAEAERLSRSAVEDFTRFSERRARDSRAALG